MIGINQLLNTNLDPPAHDGQSEASAYISYEQVAADSGSNGLRWFNDGTRTRQMYFDLDGSENGTSSADVIRMSKGTISDSGTLESAEMMLKAMGYQTRLVGEQYDYLDGRDMEFFNSQDKPFKDFIG